MNAIQRTKQMQAIHIAYGQKVRDCVLPLRYAGGGDGCHLWASDVLGRLISTLTVCADCELNVLRDALNGKPSKIHTRLRDVLSKTKKIRMRG